MSVAPLIIGFNNTGGLVRCALCRRWFGAEIGPHLFTADGLLSCTRCGDQLAPELMADFAAQMLAFARDPTAYLAKTSARDPRPD